MQGADSDIPFPAHTENDSGPNGTNLKLLATAFTPVFQLNHQCPWCRINIDRA